MEYLSFSRWTLDEPAVLRAMRATWPRRRQALRPVGALLWWAFVVSGIADGETTPLRGLSAAAIAGYASLGGAALCVVLGTALTWRDRRRAGRSVLARWWPGYYESLTSEDVELGAEPVGRR